MSSDPLEISDIEDRGNNTDERDRIKGVTGEVREFEAERIKEISQEVQEFEDSCTVASEAIKQTAEELISRIREHEERLLEEVEMRKTTEYKKHGINLDNMREMGTNSTTKFNFVQLKRIASLIDNGDVTDTPCSPASPRSPGSSPAPAGSPGPLPSPAPATDFVLPRLTFTTVRCNTAFGVIDTEAESNMGISETPFNKRRSISVSALPQNGVGGMGGMGCSPALRHRHKRSLCRLASDSDAAYSLPPRCDSLRAKVSTSEEPLNSEKLLRRNHSLREKDLVRLVSPRFGSLRHSLRHRYSRASSHENVLGCKLLWQITEEGAGTDQLRCPSDVKFLQDGRCVIADRDNERLCIYSNGGQCVKVIAKGKVKPRRLAVTKDGRIAVTDSKENIIKIFDTNGHQVTSWGKKIFKNLFKSPCGIAIMSNGNFVVSDLERHTVGIYTCEGKFLSYLGYTPGKESPKKGPPEFHSPSYVHVDSRDNIIISDSWNHSVKVYTPAGKLSFQFNKLNDEGGDLKYPNGVTIDNQGHILIADWGSHTVSVFDGNGCFRRHLVGRNDLLHHPAGISVTGSRLAVTEYSENHSSVRVYEMPAENKTTPGK